MFNFYDKYYLIQKFYLVDTYIRGSYFIQGLQMLEKTHHFIKSGKVIIYKYCCRAFLINPNCPYIYKTLFIGY